MEFTKLSEVAVVETANDEDKVLIEQNGEIKRVPKTEVGGSGGNTLIMQIDFDASTGTVSGYTANMTLDEALAAFNTRELSGCFVYFSPTGLMMGMSAMVSDVTEDVGFTALALGIAMGSNEIAFMWTADGITPQM